MDDFLRLLKHFNGNMNAKMYQFKVQYMKYNLACVTIHTINQLLFTYVV